MGRDTCSEGFESRHHILDGDFFTYIYCKNCSVCLKRPKINEKEAGMGPFLRKLFILYVGEDVRPNPQVVSEDSSGQSTIIFVRQKMKSKLTDLFVQKNRYDSIKET